MVRTRVGYTGGGTRHPTYYNLADHTEAFEVDFDPAVTSYERLLAAFWATPNSCATPYKRQYMSAIFYHNDAQKRLAEETRGRAEQERGRTITTAIEPLNEFWLAEDYHQKYLLRQHFMLLRDFKAMYPDWRDLTHSTAAAKVNGYLGGYGRRAALEAEIDGFGLRPEARDALLRAVRK